MGKISKKQIIIASSLLSVLIIGIVLFILIRNRDEINSKSRLDLSYAQEIGMTYELFENKYKDKGINRLVLDEDHDDHFFGIPPFWDGGSYYWYDNSSDPLYCFDTDPVTGDSVCISVMLSAGNFIRLGRYYGDFYFAPTYKTPATIYPGNEYSLDDLFYDYHDKLTPDDVFNELGLAFLGVTDDSNISDNETYVFANSDYWFYFRSAFRTDLAPILTWSRLLSESVIIIKKPA